MRTTSNGDHNNVKYYLRQASPPPLSELIT
jgi:hypothetical protein